MKKKGEEEWGGRGSTNESAGKRDDINSEDGRSDKGGDSSDKNEWYKYCGEGGYGFFVVGQESMEIKLQLEKMKVVLSLVCNFILN